MLGDRRLIQSIKLQNFLSFGPDTEEIELKSLNVLIGPNASGKSNLIEAIGFLQASPIDLGLPIRQGGGILEWLWKGSRTTPIAEVNATVCYAGGTMPLRHRISFTMVGQRFELADEAVENEHPDAPQCGHRAWRSFHQFKAWTDIRVTPHFGVQPIRRRLVTIRPGGDVLDDRRQLRPVAQTDAEAGAQDQEVGVEPAGL